MALRWYVVTAIDTLVEITNRVRLPHDDEETPGISVGANAEEGSGASVTIEVDDPEGDLQLLNHRRVYAIAEDAPAGHQRVGNWWISDLDVVWAEPFSAVSRTWIITMEDENSIIPRKRFVGVDVKRPAETDIARILWWLTTTEGAAVKDTLYLDTVGPKTLDKADLTGQTAEELLSACKDASGKNYFIWFNELAIAGTIVSSSVANPTVITTTAPHNLLTGAQVTISGHTGSTPAIAGVYVVTVLSATTFSIAVNVTVGGTGGTVIEPRYSLAYFNFNTYELYESAIRLSNVDAEIDGSTTFALSRDVRLSRAGGRIASGNFKPFDGPPGYVYVQDTVVRDRYVSRDVVTPAINTKVEATALAEATRQLHEMDEPDDVVTTTLTVQEAKVNAAMHGMRILVHATHLPNFTSDASGPGYAQDFIWMRIMRRLVTQMGPKTYEIPLVLTPMPFVCPEPTPEMTFPALNPVDVFGPQSDAFGNLHYLAPGVSYPSVPTPFHVGRWHFPVYDVGPSHIDYGYAGASNLLRLIVVGDGTLTIPTTIDIDNSVKGLRARLQHQTSPTDGTIIIEEEQFGESGDTFVFVISTDEMAHCVNWVDIEADPDDTSHGDTSSFQAGYAGNATWAPA